MELPGCWRRAAALTALVVCCTVDAAQLPLRRYTTADGLASNAVNDIARDSRGFLWFATQQGLSRFDGYGFSNQTTASGLPHNIVTRVLIDRRGNYWLGTAAGIVRFRPDRPQGDRGRMVTFGLPRTVTALLEDRAGRIWCGTSAGLFAVGSAGLAEVPLAAAHQEVLALAGDRDGAIWIGTHDGALYRRLPGGGIEHYGAREGLPPKEITGLLVDRKGRFWVGTEAGLYHAVMPPRPGRRIFERTAGSLPRWRVFALFEARNGDVWASFFRYLAQFPSSGGRIRLWGESNGLPRSIVSLGQDGGGNLWLGTDDLGALKLAASGFLTYSQDDGIGSVNVLSLAETRRGELFAAGHTLLGGLRVSVRSGERFVSVIPRAPPEIRYFGWRPGRSVLQDRQGEWWVASFSGLLRYPRFERPEQLALTAPQKVYRRRDGLPDEQVIRLFEDRRGNIWMSTPKKGAVWWDRRDRQFHRLAPAGSESASSFCEDAAGHLWFGDDAGQLWRAGQGGATLIAGPARRGWINDMLLDHAGRLWVATAVKGLMRFDHPEARAPEFREYGLADGLSSLNTRSLVEDADGCIYIGTGDGVDRLEPDRGRFRRYTAAEGLAPGQVHAAFRDRSGALWFGTQYGLTRMMPDSAPRRTPPGIWITGISVGGRQAPIADLGESNIRRLRVPPGQEDIQFDFVGLSFAPGDVLRYEYRLGSNAWSAPMLARSVHFGARPPGSYRFAVRAVNSDGQPSPQPAEVEFAVIPPLWRRGWFQSLLLLLAVGGALWAHRRRVRRLLEMERVRTRIATDLHDDIGSSLSQIAILSEVARQRATRGEAGEPLERIGGLSRELLDSLSDIVWAIQPHKDHLSDLKQRMRRFAADVLAARDIEIEWALGGPQDDLELDTELRRQVYLIFKEAVHNIARHARATRARIALRVAERRLELEISDNGRGMERFDDDEGNGLRSMKLRAFRLGGQIQVRSATRGGTTVLLHAPTCSGGSLGARSGIR